MFCHFLLVQCVEQTDKLENILLPLGIYTHYEYNLCLLIFFVFTKTFLKKISYILTNKRVRAILESSSKRGSFDRISSCQEFGNFLKSVVLLVVVELWLYCQLCSFCFWIETLRVEFRDLSKDEQEPSLTIFKMMFSVAIAT